MATPKLVSIVTGARVGIGKHLAEILATQGHQVIAVSRNISEMDFAEECRKQIRTIKADLTNPDAALVKIKDSLNDGEKIRYLVNNAARVEPSTTFAEASTQDFTDSLVLNVVSPVKITSGLEGMYVEGARVLMVGSGAAFKNVPNALPYCVTKAALYRSTRGLNQEMEDVSVGWVSPGATWTEMLQKVLEGLGHSEEEIQKKKEQTVEPRAAAKFFEYLLSDKVSVEDFQTKDWDIYDTFHREDWLTSDLRVPLGRIIQQFLPL